MRILIHPNEKLRAKAVPVENIDKELLVLIDTMFVIMKEHNALGLAATQLGVLQRVFVYSDQNIPKVLINPEIHIETDSTGTDLEGCLSVIGYVDNVMRAYHIKVSGLDKNGETLEFHARGLLARMIQHENDHLDGILFIDKLSIMKRDMYNRKLKKWTNKQ